MNTNYAMQYDEVESNRWSATNKGKGIVGRRPTRAEMVSDQQGLKRPTKAGYIFRFVRTRSGAINEPIGVMLATMF